MIINLDRLNKLNNIFNSLLLDKNYNIVFYNGDSSTVEAVTNKNDIFNELIKHITKNTTNFVVCDEVNYNFVLSVKELFNGKLEIIV